jgi:hypothetical protein
MQSDAGRSSCARKAASNCPSQGTARRSGREISSAVSISKDSHKRWLLADRHSLSWCLIACPSWSVAVGNPKAAVSFPIS